VAAAFCTWRDEVRETVDRRAYVLGKVAGRWGNRLLSAAFASWATLTTRSRGARDIQRRVILGLTHGLVSEVFRSWRKLVSEKVAHRQVLLARSISRTINRPLAIAFSAWLNLIRDSRARRDALHAHALRHLINHLAAMVFDAWVGFVGWKAATERLALCRCSLLGATFRTWCAWLNARQLSSRGAFVLEGLQQVGAAWLMQALGDLLPALLPEQSAVAKAMDHELRLINARSAWKPPTATTDVAVVRATVQKQLVHLAEDADSPGAARLLATARAMDSQMAVEAKQRRTMAAEVDAMKERSVGSEEQLRHDLTTLQHFVVEQVRLK